MFIAVNRSMRRRRRLVVTAWFRHAAGVPERIGIAIASSRGARSRVSRVIPFEIRHHQGAVLMTMKSDVPKIARALLALVALTAALTLSACGSDDEPSSSGKSTSSPSTNAGNGVDLAFVEAMMPHHNAAVAMATVAQKRSDRTEIHELAEAIIKSQTSEIAQMEKIARALKADGVTAGELGVPEHQMGMSGDETALETAERFDRAFIDRMVPHHQGAVRMARAVLAKGENAKVKKLAEAIIDAQAREISEMNDWRKKWYGAASPAGGVPGEGAAAGEEDGMAMPGHAE